MLDQVVCVGMKIGEPRVSVAALRELHYRLVERGLRRDSSNDSTVVQEECDESELRDHSAAGSSAGRDTASEQPGVHFSSTFRDESIARAQALSCLAHLLMLAAAGADREANDDQC